jgi:hypothetical protein
VIRSAFGKVALLALTTAIAGVAVVGCSSDSDMKKSGGVSDGKQGNVGLNLQPVSGVTINVVKYTVTQGNTPGAAIVKTGNLPVPGTGKDFSFGVPLPKGTGYFLSLTADSVDGKVTCAGGFGPFDIIANSTVDLTPTLTCTDITTGQPIVLVDVVTTACPDISFDYVVATPKTAAVGSTIGLLSNAVSASGKTLTYQWALATPATGTIAPPTAKDSTLTCDAGGDGVLLTVTADNGECHKAISTKVSCANVLCGNGVVDPGETCDKALTPATCPADCTVVCGDGNVEGTETCEPKNTAVCDANCQTRVPACGDTFINGTEQCDLSATPPVPAGTPAGQTCLAGCVLSAAPASCGDGIVGAGETCDNAGGNNYAIDNCGDVWGTGAVDGSANDCNVITSAACLTCENGSECAELTTTAILSGNAVAGPATGTPRTNLYNETLDCVRDTACAVGNVLDCYCGTVSGAQCDAGNGNGVCRTVIERGLETTNPADIPILLSNLTLGGGLALARVACDKNNCVAPCGL